MTSSTQEGTLQQRLSTLTMVAMAFAILKFVIPCLFLAMANPSSVHGLHSQVPWRTFSLLGARYRLSMALLFVFFAIWLLLLVWERWLLFGQLLVRGLGYAPRTMIDCF